MDGIIREKRLTLVVRIYGKENGCVLMMTSGRSKGFQKKDMSKKSKRSIFELQFNE